MTWISIKMDKKILIQMDILEEDLRNESETRKKF